MQKSFIKKYSVAFILTLIVSANSLTAPAETLAAQPLSTTYSIDVFGGPGGIVAPQGFAGVSSGSDFPIEIKPDPGFQIADILIDNISIGTTSLYVFTNVSSNHTFYAVFSPIPSNAYSITASAGPNGAISPVGVTSFAAGSSYTYSITPANGFEIADLLVDGVPVATSSSYTFSNISSAHSISATFRSKPLAVTPSTETKKIHKKSDRKKMPSKKISNRKKD